MDNAALVDRLADEPFNFTELSLSSFSEMDGEELLSLLAKVVAAISPLYQASSTPNGEAQADKVVRFLKACKQVQHREPERLRSQLLGGDKDLILELLNWASTSNVGALSKKAFVAYYLTGVQIPDDVGVDDDLQTLMQTQVALQQEFANLHKEAEQGRKVVKQSVGKEQITNLEVERDHIQGRINEMDAKVKGSKASKDVPSVASRLRAAQHRNGQLQEEQSREHNRVRYVTEKRDERKARLESVQNALRKECAGGMVDEINETVSQNNQRIKKELPAEMKRLQDRLGTINSTPKNYKDEESVLRLQNEKRKIETEVDEIKRQSNAKSTEEEEKQIKQQQQLVKSLEKKKADVQSKLSRMNEKAARTMGDDQENEAREQRRRLLDLKAQKYRRLKSKISAAQEERTCLQQAEEALQNYLDKLQSGQDVDNAVAAVQREIGNVVQRHGEITASNEDEAEAKQKGRSSNAEDDTRQASTHQAQAEEMMQNEQSTRAELEGMVQSLKDDEKLIENSEKASEELAKAEAEVGDMQHENARLTSAYQEAKSPEPTGNAEAVKAVYLQGLKELLEAKGNVAPAEEPVQAMARESIQLGDSDVLAF